MFFPVAQTLPFTLSLEASVSSQTCQEVIRLPRFRRDSIPYVIFSIGVGC